MLNFTLVYPACSQEALAKLPIFTCHCYRPRLPIGAENLVGTQPSPLSFLRPPPLSTDLCQFSEQSSCKSPSFGSSPTDPNQCPSSEFHKFCSSISISKESLIIPLKPLSRISRLEDISVKLSLRFQHPGYELFKR
jgi:hypothetical protein